MIGNTFSLSFPVSLTHIFTPLTHTHTHTLTHTHSHTHTHTHTHSFFPFLYLCLPFSHTFPLFFSLSQSFPSFPSLSPSLSLFSSPFFFFLSLSVSTFHSTPDGLHIGREDNPVLASPHYHTKFMYGGKKDGIKSEYFHTFLNFIFLPAKKCF